MALEDCGTDRWSSEAALGGCCVLQRRGLAVAAAVEVVTCYLLEGLVDQLTSMVGNGRPLMP